jgi:hypothetical protein
VKGVGRGDVAEFISEILTVPQNATVSRLTMAWVGRCKEHITVRRGLMMLDSLYPSFGGIELRILYLLDRCSTFSAIPLAHFVSVMSQVES